MHSKRWLSCGLLGLLAACNTAGHRATPDTTINVAPTPSASTALAPALPAAPTTASEGVLLAVGADVPDVAAPAQDGKIVRLRDLKGKPVVVYFYPKDDTPGCTVEA